MVKGMIYILTLGVFLTGTSELVVSGILHILAQELHTSIALAGQLISAYSIAFAIGTPVVVTITSRIDRRKVLVGALLVFIFGCLTSAASTTILQMMVSRMILGVSAGVYLVVALGAVAKLVAPEKLGSAIGTIVLGFSSAMILGVPLGIMMSGWFHWQAIFLSLAFLSAIIAFFVFRFFPRLEGDSPVPFREQFKVLGSSVIVTGLMITLFRESGNSVLFTYLTPYLTDILHVDSSRISLILLVIGIFGAIFSRLGGYGVDRWGASRIVMLSIIIHMGALALLPLAAASLWGALTLVTLIVASMFLAGPAIQTYFIQQAPQSASLVLSLNTSMVHLGLAAGAGAGGVMISSSSTTFYNPILSCFIIALSLTFAIISFSSKKGQGKQGAYSIP
ncbi:MFS transporter [Paenibacillus sp. GD4]|uniref:MFS transporter n=1 Tax=Paenibacillus sp. GD4 TaxID=3068890 RepID=UPI0027964CC1|nr:MFS transporter [Paenibacillus sp. GD4]MDQ1914159.1 MFS transporter [Paenibacillus sp. GD4]